MNSNNKNSGNYYRIMQKNAAVLTVVCLLLCLSFNYTFPLHRENAMAAAFLNHTQRDATEKQVVEDIVDRTKKMAANIENAWKKIMDSSPNTDKVKTEAKCSHAKQALIDGDLSNYEQLVIMKKYPYLDLKELDFNYHPPPNKNTRQSLHSVPTLGQDPSFCESIDEGPNVEITNKGLTGFAIPTKLVKTANDAVIKEQASDSQNLNSTGFKIKRTPSLNRHSDDTSPLKILEDEIKEFEKLLGP